MELWDSHCHLQDERYGADVGGVIQRALQAGVARMVCCGTREEDWSRVLELAEGHDCIVPMLGLHPWFVGEARPGWLDRLGELTRKQPLGIGECGLDFAIENPDRPRQEQAFAAQVRLARDLDRPLSIHCRQAWESLLQICREEGLPRRGAVVHAFSGSPEVARQLQDLGLFLAFGCSLANPANKRTPKALLAVREDRLLLETDSPDIPPRHLPDWPPEGLNEPRYLALVLETAARIKGVGVLKLAEQTSQAAERLFVNV
ncbi:TatD family hydrolase [Holophaga foetida]|uniref:TatD family hydrolase n=1 Tax=Holophaga foetida TaxID=35839 RepID=UPI00024721A2|nr:TatD family hydrolase [Holophaga foetida]